MPRRLRPVALVALAVMACGASAVPFGQAGARPADVSRSLDAIRDDPVRLHAFLRAMPKGGDLHSHLSGAVRTESLIRFAAADGLCIDTVSLAASSPPCGPRQRPAGDTAGDRGFSTRVLDAWSMEDFEPGLETGHDHFFATFARFGPAARHTGDMIAEVAARAAAENEFYLELLISRRSTAVRTLAHQAGFDPDLARMRDRLLANGAMASIVAAARADTDADFDRFRAVLHCGTAKADPACTLPIRLDSQIIRTDPPEAVFAQLVLGFELAEADPRYVAVNLVAPEDDPTSLRDYRLHMRMVGYLRTVYRRAHVTLHAGELTARLVPPPELRFHIRDAVLVAHSERIGHGVDVAQEADSEALLSTMAAGHVLVEVALTSNRQILGVFGNRHPLALYRRHHVPVTLVTDDEGVERIDGLTSQYEQAVRVHGLRYEELKVMARAAIDHGFLEGASLWRGPDDFRPAPPCERDTLGGSAPGPACHALLQASERAAAEWRQETAFARFEHGDRR
ncbi:MAG TPA: adenosine deaminase [Candidatus Dormibacteraeota bacterium]|nr:adenosine deaminase [Candidatus Dormibacteraeota bacterium]